MQLLTISCQSFILCYGQQEWMCDSLFGLLVSKLNMLKINVLLSSTLVQLKGVCDYHTIADDS